MAVKQMALYQKSDFISFIIVCYTIIEFVSDGVPSGPCDVWHLGYRFGVSQ